MNLLVIPKLSSQERPTDKKKITISQHNTILRLLFFVMTLLLSAIIRAETTIEFTGFSSNDLPLTFYNEDGFTISSSSGEWMSGTWYGNPSPFIYFNNPDGTNSVTASIRVTKDRSTFYFNSVDLYSSITQIDYRLEGYLGSNIVFTETGTIPNTFGNFAIAVNSHDNDVIDTLEITLTNPSSCCANPMGVDNVVVFEDVTPCAHRYFDSDETAVIAAYVAYYGRCPDRPGFDYWSNRLRQEGGLGVIIDAFGTSQEYTERFGSLDNAQLIDNLYQQLFHRSAETDGLSFYTELLESGQSTLPQIAFDILYGAQNDDVKTLQSKQTVCHHFVTTQEQIGISDIDLPDDSIANVLHEVSAESDTDISCVIIDNFVEIDSDIACYRSFGGNHSFVDCFGHNLEGIVFAISSYFRNGSVSNPFGTRESTSYYLLGCAGITFESGVDFPPVIQSWKTKTIYDTSTCPLVSSPVNDEHLAYETVRLKEMKESGGECTIDQQGSSFEFKASRYTELPFSEFEYCGNSLAECAVDAMNIICQ